MSVLEILDTLLLKPLMLIFEIIYNGTNNLIDNPGASIIILSFFVNILVLPLYMRADAMQEAERKMEMQLQNGVKHIKKTFSGDEQMMILRTFYRQNNYKPTYVFRSAISLFLEIPFFIAAYRFLSSLQILNGISFGPISDLGSPDGILQIAGLSINILPFIMTAVNLISCVLFTKDSPMKTKLQLYGMALFFLFFLYSSPAGLVFYWTLNNLFSLIKTIFYKLKNPRKIINIIFMAAGIWIWIYYRFFFINQILKPRMLLFFTLLGLILQFPAIIDLLRSKALLKEKLVKDTANKPAFLSGSIFLSVLLGIFIPSTVIKSSPQEFVSIVNFYHPIWYIISSFCIALGIFILWMGVFYWLASPSVKPFFEKGIWIFSGIAILNQMLFNKNFGTLSVNLKYENVMSYTSAEQLLNLIILLIFAIILLIIYKFFKKRIYEILIIGTVALGIMSVVNISHINSSIGELLVYGSTESPEFTLSRTGKNVVIIMLDRAMGEEIPFIFNEKPELKTQFDGFTYYSNAISFGYCTNFGLPALLGGYEYTPIELNRRDSEPLVDKHNEALKVMPVLFDENGYEVTVINPVYANYQQIPDTTIYNDYPDIHCYADNSKVIIDDTFTENNSRNFFCYSMLRTTPLYMQEFIYDSGRYNQPDTVNSAMILSAVESRGLSNLFLKPYMALKQLPGITNITTENVNTFLFMANDLTHEPTLLQEPDYVPSVIVDNTEYEDFPLGRIMDGRVLKLEDEWIMMHYHTNMAAMIQLGNWLDYLREENVYDNTRIILVSDHAHSFNSLDELILDNGTCVSGFFPLLMVKDFGSSGFNTCDEFMTNADVPVIAMDGIIDNPVNPFTGKIINSDEKTAHDQYIIDSTLFNTDINNGNTFLPADWYSIHDSIWDKNNWNFVAEDAILKEYY